MCSNCGMTLLRKETVDQETQYLVYGFIYEAEKLLELDTIPSLIIELCLSFFYLSIVDAIFSIHNEQITQLSQDKKTITQIQFNRIHCSFGLNQVPSINNKSKYEWDISIINMDISNRNHRDIFIGISSLTKSNNKQKLLGYNYLYNIRTVTSGAMSCAAYHVEGKRSINRKFESRWHGKIYKAGDKVTVCLDLERKPLSFKLNEIDHGVAFDDIKVGPNIKYRLIVRLYEMDHSVKIERFRKL